MSFKYAAQQVSPFEYVLPRSGGMKVDVHAFLSEALYEASDEALWSQAANGASYEGVTGAYLMPDCHSGFGVPIGFVMVTDGTLVQAGSGYDISCGVLLMRITGVTIQQIQDPEQRTKLVQAISNRVATGLGGERPPGMPHFTGRKVDEVLRHGARAIGVHADLCERQFIEIPEDLDLQAIPKAYNKAIPQLGSLGSGNHFIELQANQAGELWVMIHTGSRGYGWQTAEHFFLAGAELRGIARGQREASWLHVDEPLGQAYWAHHNSAANYAIANRFVIAQQVQRAIQEVLGGDAEVHYDISHNLIQQETLVLPDGSTRQGFVHRKGATRAMPAGHPDLKGTRWADTGHPVLIPGSMFDGAAILRPLEGAYKTGCSVNHGSGRVLGRGAAKRQLGEMQELIDAEMRDCTGYFGGLPVQGVVSNHEQIPLDECRLVYKSLDAVLDVLTQGGIAEVVDRLKPIANIKGVD